MENKMRFGLTLVTSVILAVSVMDAQSGTSILFVGNSFTYGAGSPVRFYRAHTVTDLNNEGIGGVPALFRSFAQQAGLNYDVFLETRGGGCCQSRSILNAAPRGGEAGDLYVSADAGRPWSGCANVLPTTGSVLIV